MQTSDVMTVGQVARVLGCPPRILSYYLYVGKLDKDRCPVVGEHRLIPRDYVPEIRQVLQRAGKLPEEATS